jgi:hypothetical protein
MGFNMYQSHQVAPPIQEKDNQGQFFISRKPNTSSSCEHCLRKKDETITAKESSLKIHLTSRLNFSLSVLLRHDSHPYSTKMIFILSSPLLAVMKISILTLLWIFSDTKARSFHSAQSPSLHPVTVQSMILTVTFHYQVRFVS